MKVRDYIPALIITLIIILPPIALNELGKKVQVQVDEINSKITKINNQIDDLHGETSYLERKTYDIEATMDDINSDVAKLKRVKPISRGTISESITVRATAYDTCYRCCKKLPSAPGYGVTASGAYVREWYTVAAAPDIKFGTKLYIPYFRDNPNRGVFVVQDRGGAVDNGELDIYMKKHDDCIKFGVRNLKVYMLGE